MYYLCINTIIIQKEDMKKQRKTHNIYLPDEYLNEATGHVEMVYEVDQQIAGDDRLAAKLNVGRQTIHRWKQAGIIAPRKTKSGRYFYDLQETLDSLRQHGYQFEHEVGQ